MGTINKAIIPLAGLVTKMLPAIKLIHLLSLSSDFSMIEKLTKLDLIAPDKTFKPSKGTVYE